VDTIFYKTKRVLQNLDRPRQGCQIFLGATYQNGKNIPNKSNGHQMFQIDSHKIYQIGSHKIYKHLPLQDPPKFTRTGIFG
jgi:hypothetical protein